MKKIICILISILLIVSLFSITANAATRTRGDVDSDTKVSVLDATYIQKSLASIAIPFTMEKAVADVDDDNTISVLDATSIQKYLASIHHAGNQTGKPYEVYSLNAELTDSVGVYEIKAVKGDRMDGDNAKTVGIPRVAKQNLADGPTLDAPAIITGAANGFETKTGPVEYTMNEGLTEEDIPAPYSYFRHRIIDETITDAYGNRTTHKKLSGFDGSYYIIRVDVSDIIEGKTGYLHVKQESNKALMVQVGMLGGVSTGEIGQNADGAYTEAPHIDEATHHWFVGTKDTGIEVGAETPALSYVDADGIWCVAGTGFSDGLGNKTQTYSLADNAKALKDKNGDTPYVDIILMSSAKTVAGADAGKENAPSADVKLSMYVDDTWDYHPALTYDPASTDVNHVTNCMNKFFSADAFTTENNAASYLVKGSDLEIDVVTDDHQNDQDKPEYWSMTKAIAYPEYDSHNIKLICEVPVLEGLLVEGCAEQPRTVILDVNSFDIQVANHSETNTAGLTVKDNATLTITDNSKTSGAELAIGNNASMEVFDGGTLIISDSCQLGVEYDAATITQSPPDEAAPADNLSNGVITVHSGGKIVNNGVINIEGLEVKPVQSNTQEQEQQQTVTTDMKASSILVEEGGVIDNYGCISLKGNLYILGTLNNYGQYGDLIAAQDPDKGTIDYHKGIQLTWKDDVTVLDEATNTYSVNPDVTPGALFIGSDAEGNINANAQLNNYGDLVLVPGVLNIYAQLNNLKDGEIVYPAGLYICSVTQAVVPIQPDPNDPTKTEERRRLNEPYPSTINKGETAVINNNGYICEAAVEVLSNGVLGDMIVSKQIEI